MSIRMFNSCVEVFYKYVGFLKEMFFLFGRSTGIAFLVNAAWLGGKAETALFVVCEGDRQEVRPSRPCRYHLLSVWFTSGGLASYFSGKTSNINGVLWKICLLFCINHSLLSRLCSPTSIDRLGNRQSLYRFTFPSYEKRRWSLILMGLILGRKDGGKVKERKDKGGKVKMMASSHWIWLQLVGGRKRGQICEGTENLLPVEWLFLSFFLPYFATFLFCPSLLFLLPSFLPFILDNLLCFPPSHPSSPVFLLRLLILPFLPPFFSLLPTPFLFIFILCYPFLPLFVCFHSASCLCLLSFLSSLSFPPFFLSFFLFPLLILSFL